MARKINGSEGTSKRINNEYCEDDRRAMGGRTRYLIIAGRPVDGWRGRELSEFHEGVVEGIDHRDGFVPHQSRNILRRWEGEVRKVPCII